MNQLRIGSLLTAAIAALALSQSAGAVTVSLVTDGTPGELQMWVNGLGTAPAQDVSAFDVGLVFNTATLTLTAANMTLNTGKLDDGSGFSYGSCAEGSDGSQATGGLGGCSGVLGPAKAEMQYVSFIANDVTLAGIENPGHAASYNLEVAVFDFTGTGNVNTVSMLWGGLRDIKGSSGCPAPSGNDPFGQACVIYPGPSTVPEPGTLALLGAGMLGSLALTRRRQRSVR